MKCLLVAPIFMLILKIRDATSSTHTVELQCRMPQELRSPIAQEEVTHQIRQQDGFLAFIETAKKWFLSKISSKVSFDLLCVCLNWGIWKIGVPYLYGLRRKFQKRNKKNRKIWAMNGLCYESRVRWALATESVGAVWGHSNFLLTQDVPELFGWCSVIQYLLMYLVWPY